MPGYLGRGHIAFAQRRHVPGGKVPSLSNQAIISYPRERKKILHAASGRMPAFCRGAIRASTSSALFQHLRLTDVIAYHRHIDFRFSCR